VGDYATVMNPDPDQAERAFERIIGNGAALESVLSQVEQVAPTDSTVLIEGETGTGKNSLLTPFTMQVSAMDAHS